MGKRAEEAPTRPLDKAESAGLNLIPRELLDEEGVEQCATCGRVVLQGVVLGALLKDMKIPREISDAALVAALRVHLHHEFDCEVTECAICYHLGAAAHCRGGRLGTELARDALAVERFYQTPTYQKYEKLHRRDLEKKAAQLALSSDSAPAGGAA